MARDAGDLYAILGVARSATTAEIKRAFRSRVREVHPDVAGDAADTEAFTRLKRAYETLVDPRRRALYDRRSARRASGRPRWRDPGPGNDLDLDDLLGGDGILGFGFGSPGARRAARPGPVRRSRRGADVTVRLELDHALARDGGTTEVRYRRGVVAPGAGALRAVEASCEVRIPAGTRDGAVLRLAGRGDAGLHGGPPGDLVLEVRVRPPPEPPPGAVDEVPITVAEAILGARVPVVTPAGRVTLVVPPGTSGGTRFRLRGQGPEGPDGVRADHHVRVRILVPREVDDELRALAEALARRERK